MFFLVIVVYLGGIPRLYYNIINIVKYSNGRRVCKLNTDVMFLIFTHVVNQMYQIVS